MEGQTSVGYPKKSGESPRLLTSLQTAIALAQGVRNLRQVLDCVRRSRRFGSDGAQDYDC
jgi:hypothetical protein